MEKFSIRIFLCSFLIVLFLVQSSCQAEDHDDDHREVEDEREFNYEEDSGKGPDHWGEIRQEWSMCNKGSMQSPIDLLDDRVEVVSNLATLETSYRPGNATLKNRGHDMMLKWQENAGYVRINGTLFQLKQCHWHSSSEHTINGKRLDLEMHLVHESAAGQAAVIGILYEIGEPDPFLTLMMDKLAAVAGTREKQTVVGMVDPKQIKSGSTKYYSYLGSLTIPPCTQNVIWNIDQEIRTVSKEQVKFLRVAVHDESETNARPVQARNRRVVQLYRTTIEEDD